jgi:hypothetical protein
MALAMDHERWVPLPRLRLLLYGEMALLIFLPTPTPTGSVPAQLALPRGARAWSRGRGACESSRALGGEGWRLEIPGELRDEPASGGVGLRTLVLLRRGQLPPQIFDRTAQLNKDMIGQRVVALPDWQGIEGLG